MVATGPYDYLERLCNLLRVQTRAAGAAFGLLPVQLGTLRYLGTCNRFSDTPQAVTEYLGQTKGTVSQTVKVLETKGMLTKVSDTVDRRIVHLKITAQGRQALADSVSVRKIRDALESLSARDQVGLRKGLQALLHSVQKENGLRTFSTCITCRFNRETSDGHVCGLTGETLSDADLELICREHAYPPGSTHNS